LMDTDRLSFLASLEFFSGCTERQFGPCACPVVGLLCGCQCGHGLVEVLWRIAAAHSKEPSTGIRSASPWITMTGMVTADMAER